MLPPALIVDFEAHELQIELAGDVEKI